MHDIHEIQKGLTDEMFRAIEAKYDGWMRRNFSGFGKKPLEKFANLLAKANAAAETNGLYGASKALRQEMGVSFVTQGEEAIPEDGPMLIASNHPGAYDMLCLGETPARKDLNVIASEIPFYKKLHNIYRSIIGVTTDPVQRFSAMRKGISHLKSGGSMLLFPGGQIEADPQCEPGATQAINEWKPSLEIFLRKAPDTQLVLAVVSGVLEREFRVSPVTWFRKLAKDKRRLAEFAQVARMMLRGEPPAQTVHISFAKPIRLAELLARYPNAEINEAIQRYQIENLKSHLTWLNAKGIESFA